MRHSHLAEAWLPQRLPDGVYGAKNTPSADVLTYHTCRNIEQAIRDKLLPGGLSYDFEKAFDRVPFRLQKTKERKDQTNELKVQQDKQQERLDILHKRQDRLGKSIPLVVEHSSEIEAIFTTAETSRIFKDVARDSAAKISRSWAIACPSPIRFPPAENYLIWERTNRSIPCTLFSCGGS